MARFKTFYSFDHYRGRPNECFLFIVKTDNTGHYFKVLLFLNMFLALCSTSQRKRMHKTSFAFYLCFRLKLSL